MHEILDRLKSGWRVRHAFLIGATMLCVAATGAPADSDSVTVRILGGHRPTSVRISVSEQALLLHGPNGFRGRIGSHKELVIENWSGWLRARWTHGSVAAGLLTVQSAGGEPIRLEYTRSDGKRESRSYRGTLLFELEEADVASEIRILNRVHLADYLASVVPVEFPFKQIEGVKAQAIISRTYAVTSGKKYDFEYDLTDDVGSQVYRGAGAETELARRAVDLTDDIILTYDRKPIEAVYSSHCGGHSANNEDVWASDPVPYLRGKPDPFDARAPLEPWKNRASRSRVLNALSDHVDAQVSGIGDLKRGVGERVVEVELLLRDGGRRILPGQVFRSVVNASSGKSVLKSTLFEVSRSGDSYVFAGRGNGHGVGLCQWGAAKRAEAGHDVSSILQFYYSGVELRSIEEADRGEQIAAAATKPERPFELTEPVVESEVSPADDVRIPTQGRRPRVKRRRRPGW